MLSRVLHQEKALALIDTNGANATNLREGEGVS
jgi:hypothetical protein